MSPNSYELQIAALLAAVIDDDAGRCEMPLDALVSMAQAFAPLLEDAVEYYLQRGVAPQICGPAA